MANDANIIKIKRSGTSGAPSSLKLGELAYSYLAASGNPTSNGGDRLFIGAGGVDGLGNANDLVVIGGKYFTDLLDHTRGTLTASSALIADGNSVIDRILTTGLNIGGISGGGLDYTISTDNNNNLVLSTGTGKVSINGAYTLPNADGTAGYVLTTNGSGVVSWAAAVASLTVDAGTGGPQTVNLLTDTLTTVSADGNISTSVAKLSTTVTTTLTLSSDLTINSVSSLTGTGAVELTSSPDGTTLHTWLLNTDGTTSFNNNAYIFPAADGTNGYVLTTNGSGVISWGTPWTSAGYQTSSDVSTYVTGLGYQTSSDVSTYVTGLGYQTSGDVSSSISTALTGYAHSSDTLYVGTTAVTLNQASGTVSALTGINSISSAAGTGSVNINATADGTTIYNWQFKTDGTTQFPNYTFPAGHGTSGQVLVDDGSGNLSWGAQAASFTVTGTTGSQTFNITTDTLNTVSGNSNLSVAVSKASTTLTSTFTLASTLTGLTEVDVGDLILSGNTIENGSNGTGDVSLVANNGGGDKTWTFAGDGTTTFPTGGHIGATKGGTMLDGGFGYGTSLTSYYASGMYSSCVTANANGNLTVTTYGDGTGQAGQWTFGLDGTTAFPNFTFPSANGTTGQVLTANATTGLLSWTTLSQSFYIGTTQITTGNASGSVTTIAGLTEVDVGDLVLSGSTVSTASDTGNVNIVASTTHGDQTWTFDGSGVLTLPVTAAGGGIGGEIVFPSTIAGIQATINYNADVPGGAFELINTDGSNTLYIGLDLDGQDIWFYNTTPGGGQKTWSFNADGGTRLPNYTLPGTAGTSGQVLTYPGSGSTLAWTTLSQSFYIGDTQITTGNTSGTVTSLNIDITGKATTAGTADQVANALSQGANIQSFSFNGSSTATVALATTLTGLTEVDVGDLVLNTNTISNGSSTGGAVTIESNDGTHNHTWTFGQDGNLELPMSGTITNVPNPVNPNEVANKAYVDATASGLKIHQPVTVATTAALSTIGGTVSYADGNDIASPSVGSTLSFTTPITILDGYTFQGDERILVKDQVNAKQNGVYVYTSSTSWTRATDFDHAGLISGADFMFVEDGVKNGSTGWVQTDQNITSIGATGSDITFVQFSAANSYVAGDGVQITGNSIAVKLATNSGLSTSGGSLTISGIAGTAATTGLTYSSGVLQIGTDGTSIGINASGYLEIKSTWSGQSAITTVGTISSGTWQGTVVAETYGGTNQSSYAKGDILYASATNTLSKLAAGTNGQTIQLQGGVPVWADLDGGTY